MSSSNLLPGIFSLPGVTLYGEVNTPSFTGADIACQSSYDGGTIYYLVKDAQITGGATEIIDDGESMPGAEYNIATITDQAEDTPYYVGWVCVLSGVNSNVLYTSYETAAPELTNPQNTPTGDGATLTIESNSDAGTLYSYSKTTPFTGTDEENAAEIITNGVGQSPSTTPNGTDPETYTNTRVVTGQDQLTDHYAGWVQDSDGYGGDMVLVFNMGAGETLTIPGGTGTYLYNVDHGDGEFSEGLTTEGFSHTYTDANPETVVRISGTFPYIYFNTIADTQKLTKILNLGSVGWAAGARSFKGALNVTELTVGVTDTSLIEFAQDMFRAFTHAGMVPKIAGMDMSSAINISGMLAQWSGAGAVDIPIYSWSIGNVINFTSLLLSSKLTTVCYDRTLASWGNQTLAAGASGQTIHFGTSQYTDAASHALLLAQVTNIIDGGLAP